MFGYIFIKANVIKNTYTAWTGDDVYVSYSKCLNPVDNRDLKKYF